MTAAPPRRRLLLARPFFGCAYPRTTAPARALAAEALTLERALSYPVNQACALTPAEIALMWQTAPPRMPIPPTT
jgi:hypothetical protein